MQIAFCFVVHFVAGLFVATLDKLSNQPTGFSAERILNLETIALTVWPLMSGESCVGFISIGGAPPSEVFSDLLSVSPGWFNAMRIPLIDGRDFRAGDTSPAVAIVNVAFAKQYFNGENPIGKSFERMEAAGGRVRCQIVGFVRDARSRDNLRLPIRPTAYIPFRRTGTQSAFVPLGRGTFIVRTSSPNPLALASILRQEVPRARPEFRVGNIRTQTEINHSHTVRERLLAMLAPFFAVVALCLLASACMVCSTTPCSSGGAKLVFAWLSARRPATSRGW